MNELISKLNSLESKVIDNINLSKSLNTLRAYKSDFNDFENFCLKFNFPSMPTNPKVVGLYLSELSAELKFSTLKRRLASINVIHKIKGHYFDFKHPFIKENLAGIKRKIGIKQIGKKPLLYNDLLLIIDYINNNLVNKNELKIRDKAILLIGFSGGFRRSELADLKTSDIEFVNEGVKINIQKSKNDQFGEGQIKAIPYFKKKEYCPVLALKEWIKLKEIEKKTLFQCSDKMISLIIKKYIKLIGLDDRDYSGHSLRSGFATSTAGFGADERSIMAMTGHKSAEMVRRYIREANLFKNNPLDSLNK